MNTDIQRIIQTVTQAAGGHTPVYLVGGAVRDMLLGRDGHDLDFAVPGRTRGLAGRVADALGGAMFVLDSERDTTRVILDLPGQKYRLLDFASFRAGDLEGDLRARDFSINAMAMELDAGVEGRLIDPCGGKDDLLEKRIRACTPHSLADDPARVLRAVRLAVALGFRIESETLRQVRAAAVLLAGISPERQRDELVRILESDRTSLTVRLLEKVGSLEFVLPELKPLAGLAQPEPHVLDAWEHTLEVVDRLESLLGTLAGEYHEAGASGLVLGSAVLWLGRYREQFAQHLAEEFPNHRSLTALLKFSALYHDSGKASTGKIYQDGKLHFYGHEEHSQRMATGRARSLAFSNLEVDRIGLIIRGHMRVHVLSDAASPPSPRAIYRFFRDTGDGGVDICLHSLADMWATYGYTLPQERWLKELQTCRSLLEGRWEKTEKIVKPPRLVDGSDLMRAFKIQPGRLIGELLEAIREAQAAGEVHTRDEALAFALKRIEGANGGSDV
jgi:tRNA nucleotidyltransferase/poly(A) polymerase